MSILDFSFTKSAMVVLLFLHNFITIQYAFNVFKLSLSHCIKNT